MSTTNRENIINCDVIGDLIPLYVDDALSESGKALVEAHIAECGSCAGKVRLLTEEIQPASHEAESYQAELAPLKKIKKSITRRQAMVCAVTAGVMLMIFGVYVLINYLELVTADYTYSDLKDYLKIVSSSDFSTTGDKKSVSLVYASKDKHIKCFKYFKKVGNANGKIQVEAYVTAFHQPLDDINPFYRPYSYIDSVGGYLLLCDDTKVSYKSGGEYVSAFWVGENYNFDELDFGKSEIEQEDMEIVRIYYSKNHLLWSKPGYEN